MRRLLMVIIFTAVPTLLHAATYYVAKTGSGSTCSQASPCLTIATGLSKLSAGDTLVIGTGTYTESINDTIPSGISDTTRTMVMADTNAVVTVNGSSGGYVLQMIHRNYVTISGITFDNSNAGSGGLAVAVVGGTDSGDTTGSSYIRFQNVNFANAQHFSCFAVRGLDTSAHTNHIEFIGGSVHDCGTTLPSNDAGQVGGHGIYAKFRDSVIDRVTFYNIGTMPGATTGEGIHQYANSGTGIDNNIYRNNRFYAFTASAILISSGSGTLAYNNIIYNGNTVGGTGAIRVYDGGVGAKIFNNTLYHNGGYCIWNQSGSGVYIQNNICYLNASNIVLNNGSSTVMSNNITSGDPSFTNASAGDFSLQGTSIARNTGLTIAVVDRDVAGNPRPQENVYDIGAFEYMGSTTKIAPPANLRVQVH